MLKLKEILNTLIQNKVEFVIIGGMAAVAMGSAYVTNDIDLCYQRNDENFKAIVKALKPFNPKLRTKEGSIPFLFDEITLKNGLNFTFNTDLGPLDLLGEVAGVGKYEDMIAAAVHIDVYGFSCAIISIDDLIKSKKAAGRTKDLLMLDELEALKKLKSSF